ncbi:hypothetical protein [Microbulbifer epialgicus]|uniref:Transposase IS200 like n=1 Tax=Microbulbifer epialgicus TaxID=393907 RepID=A0ABV4P226_9GAMM
MQELAEVFALDVATYAVMSNHYHIVLYIDAETESVRSTAEFIVCWQRLFKGSALA